MPHAKFCIIVLWFSNDLLNWYISMPFQILSVKSKCRTGFLLEVFFFQNISMFSWKASGFGYCDWLMLGFVLRMLTVMYASCFLASSITRDFRDSDLLLLYFFINAFRWSNVRKAKRVACVGALTWQAF